MKRGFWCVGLVVAGLVVGTWAWADDPHGMSDMRMADTQSSPAHHAIGTVKSKSAEKGTVTISHGAVKTLNWPAMTMTFAVKEKAQLDKFQEGKRVEFDFVQDGANYTIVRVK